MLYSSQNLVLRVVRKTHTFFPKKNFVVQNAEVPFSVNSVRAPLASISALWRLVCTVRSLSSKQNLVAAMGHLRKRVCQLQWQIQLPTGSGKNLSFGPHPILSGEDPIMPMSKNRNPGRGLLPLQRQLLCLLSKLLGPFCNRHSIPGSLQTITIDQNPSKSIKNDQKDQWGFDLREEIVQ